MKDGNTRLSWPKDPATLSPELRERYEAMLIPGEDPLDQPSERDVERKKYLDFAVLYEPKVAEELVAAGDNATKLKAWKKKWRLTEPWCVRIMRNYRPPAPPEVLDGRAFILHSLHRTGELIRDGVLPPWPKVGEIDDDYDESDFDDSDDDGCYWDMRYQPREFKMYQPFFYSPVDETPDRFKKRVLDYVNKAIDDFCTRAMTDGKAGGLVAVEMPAKRTRKNVVTPSPDRHFDWLARYQVLGHSYSKIESDFEREWFEARKLNPNLDQPPSRQAITYAVKKTAPRIGVKNLRESLGWKTHIHKRGKQKHMTKAEKANLNIHLDGDPRYQEKK